ncbi:DUF7553 family protein [Halegenticoccus tardaugens]|uniref:DUF7553 family protein n=1 Tax=Halegenticoccus tardaugens TaxID=2071624 RepID=UPI00100B99DE|nr:hypothetical protein [Halegenticoccus tardaugens]
MTRSHLRAANRALLRAIRTPPDTGVESEIDRIADSLWTLARADRRPDPDRLRRLRRRLADLESRVAPERAACVRRARAHLRAYRRTTAAPFDSGADRRLAEAGARI